MAKLEKKIKIEATVTLLTGLHIGGNTDNVEIGGIDSPVIKLATKDGQPYIPGSSLKGKMRCLLEQAFGIAKVGDTGKEMECGKMNVRDFFGYAGNNNAKPSRLIVRDAMLTDESESALRTAENLDMPYTEGKNENTIDRVTARSNPRLIERVPAGAKFKAEFIINKWDDDDEQQQIELFREAISLLENDYLGGSGSRGYGQVHFDFAPKSILFSHANDWKGTEIDCPVR